MDAQYGVGIANKELDVILKQYTDYQNKSESVLTQGSGAVD